MESENDEKVGKDYTRVGYALVLCLVASYIWDIFFFVMVLIIFVQMLLSLLNDEPNQQITNFSRSLGKVIAGGFSYAFFLTDDKPFPFSPWPSSPNAEEPEMDSEEDSGLSAEVVEPTSIEQVGKDDDQNVRADTATSGEDSGDSSESGSN